MVSLGHVLSSRLAFLGHNQYWRQVFQVHWRFWLTKAKLKVSFIFETSQMLYSSRFMAMIALAQGWLDPIWKTQNLCLVTLCSWSCHSLTGCRWSRFWVSKGSHIQCWNHFDCSHHWQVSDLNSKKCSCFDRQTLQFQLMNQFYSRYSWEPSPCESRNSYFCSH